MATNTWLGIAPAIAQSGTVTLTYTSGSTTYSIIIGGITVSITDSTSATHAAAALVTACTNLTTSPYFSALTFTNTLGVINVIADVAGCPFTLTTNATGGVGSIGSYTPVITATGPNDWANAANWSNGTVPANSDNVYFNSTSASNVCWGLSQSAVTLATLTIQKDYVGTIGLNSSAFATNAAGTSFAAVPEYRPEYLSISSSLTIIGEDNNVLGSPSGSGRIMLNLGTVASQEVIVQSTAVQAAERSKPSIRLLVDSATATLAVQSATSGVGIAVDQAGETSTLNSILVTDFSNATQVITGIGTTLTSWTQNGGTNVLQAAGNITDLVQNGGTLTIVGEFNIGTAAIFGGKCIATQTDGSAVAFVDLILAGGTVDFSQSPFSQSITTLSIPIISDGVLIGSNSTTLAFYPVSNYILTMR